MQRSRRCPAARSRRADRRRKPQQEGAQPPPIFRTGINFVRVDVIVTDSKTGQPVTDLKQSDFEVIEDNKPQTVETFKLIELDGGAAPGPDGPPQAIRTDTDEELEAARDDVRLFAIFLDDYHVRRGASVSVREPIARFIETQLGPSDMLGVMYPLQAVSSVRMTRDHGRVIRGLGAFVGRKFDYTPRNRLEEQYANYPAEDGRAHPQSGVAVGDQGSHLAHGVAQGRPQGPDPGQRGLQRHAAAAAARSRSRRCPGSTIPNRDNPAGGRQRSPARTAGSFSPTARLELTLREVWDLANKNNVAIYAVDPRGLPVSEFDLSQPTISLAVDRQYLNATMDTLRDAGRADRRPRHRQSQRSRRRHEADCPRHERVLPARVQLDPGAVGRQVPRDQGAGEAARHPGARAERATGR